MKPITDLHLKHENKEIFIVGSDPTLENYPDDFLDDKLSITLHLAYMKFPNATYHYFNERDRFIYLQEKFPEIFDKVNIFGYPFYNRSKEASDEVIGNARDKAYYLDLKPYPSTEVMKSKVIEAKKGKSNLYGGNGTCLHPCMYVAIMMGCNPINIIGCGFQTIGKQEHFGEANKIDNEMRPKQLPFSAQSRTSRMTCGLEAIIDGCNDNGIIVNRLKDYNEAKKTL